MWRRDSVNERAAKLLKNESRHFDDWVHLFSDVGDSTFKIESEDPGIIMIVNAINKLHDMWLIDIDDIDSYYEKDEAINMIHSRVIHRLAYLMSQVLKHNLTEQELDVLNEDIETVIKSYEQCVKEVSIIFKKDNFVCSERKLYEDEKFSNCHKRPCHTFGKQTHTKKTQSE